MRIKYRNIKFKMLSDDVNIIKHPGYSTWDNMRSRCYNSKNKDYKRYGGRGIKICKDWLNNSAKFLLWFEDNYKKGCTIDRIDNNGDYESKNCRFATPKEQVDNRKYNRSLGANYDKSTEKWVSRIGIDRKLYIIGYFKYKKDAIAARCQIIDIYEKKGEYLAIIELGKLKKLRKDRTIGVTFHKNSKKWKSYYQHNKKQVMLGSFKTRDSAISARNKALEELQ